MIPNSELAKIQKRLQKLLALSASPNKAEAEAAINKAKEIMEKYNIRTIDVDIETNTANVSHCIIPGYSTKRALWQVELGASIATCFDGRSVTTEIKGKGWHTTFIASNTEIELIKDLYIRLRRIIGRMAKVYADGTTGDKRTKRNAYAHGAVEAVYWRIKEIYKVMKPEDMALVVCKKDSIEELSNNIFKDLRKDNTKKQVDDLKAYHQGIHDGRTINLSRSIEGTETTRIGGTHGKE